MAGCALDDLLASIPLLSGLAHEEIAEIAGGLQYGQTPPNTTLITEGSDAVPGLVFLLAGTVEVRKRGYDRRNHIISLLIGPTVFGEIEVVARRPAIASVVTCTDVKTAILSTALYHEMNAADRPCVLKIARNLAYTLSCRLAATDERLAACFDFPERADPGWLRAAQATLYAGACAGADATEPPVDLHSGGQVG